MRRALAVLLLSLPLAANAQATAYFYCDTALTIVGQCGIWVDAGAKVTIATVAVGTIQTCKYDVTALAFGAHTLKCSAIAVADPTWGSQESVPSSMVYTKTPPTLGGPTNLRVGP